MTQDEIIRSSLGRDQIIDLAREAGFTDYYPERLKRFYELAFAAGAAAERNRLAWTQEHWTQYEHAIAAAEREACAKVCDDIAKCCFVENPARKVVESIAAAIRSRGEK